MPELPEVAVAEVSKHYHGSIDDVTEEYVQARLDEVIDAIALNGWKDLVLSRLASGILPERHYKAIVVRVASRVFSNPEGLRKESEGQYSYEVSSAAASGMRWFTSDDQFELTGIRPPEKGRSSQIPSSILVSRAAPTFGLS